MTEAGAREDAVETSGAAGPSVEDWVQAFRGAVEAQKAVFSEHEGIAARTEYEGVGEGGDHTLVIDRLCEDAIFAELERLHDEGHEFEAISEERGTISFGGGPPLRVVIDPIDGSMNARRTIPCHSVSIAVADGDSMADVRLGYVYEFGAGEEFIATAGAGATLDGRPIAVPDGDGLEVVALEATKPERVLKAAHSLQDRAYRMRAPGSIAVSLCYVAAGRFDGMATGNVSRSVDAAAAQLVVREAGGFVSFLGHGGVEARLNLDARYRLVAAQTPEGLDLLAGALTRAGLPG